MGAPLHAAMAPRASPGDDCGDNRFLGGSEPQPAKPDSVMVSDFWGGEAAHWPDGEVPAHLISGNQKHLLEGYAKALAERGKFVVLLSNCREFIFGDGMLHNFRTGGPVSPTNPRCLVPLTPAIAVAYDCPSSCSQSVSFVTVTATLSEVEAVNEITLIYSGRHIYYRNELPRNLAAFEVGRHQQLQYHRDAWFDEMMKAAANTWFPAARKR